MNLTNGRWREAAFANEVFVEMVERAGVEFGDWQATNERANVPIVGGTVLGSRGGGAWMAVDVLIDELAQRHLAWARRFDAAGGTAATSFASSLDGKRLPPNCAADVPLLASDRVMADENTKLPSAW